MKILSQTGHQGDCQFYSIDKIPSGAKKVNKQFIAASERSGSMHALFGDYDQYKTDDGFVIDAHEDCILNHSLQKFIENGTMDEVKQLPPKDHRHSVIKKGLYYVGIQQKFDPLAGIKKRVID